MYRLKKGTPELSMEIKNFRAGGKKNPKGKIWSHNNIKPLGQNVTISRHFHCFRKNVQMALEKGNTNK